VSATSPGEWQPTVDPRQRLYERWFTTWNRRLVIALALVAIMGLTLGDPWGRTLSVIAIAGVIAAPLLRVVALTVLWVRQRDWRFVLMAVALLIVVVLGVVAAALRSR
jgi:Na+/proline symporter